MEFCIESISGVFRVIFKLYKKLPTKKPFLFDEVSSLTYYFLVIYSPIVGNDVKRTNLSFFLNISSLSRAMHF